MRKTKHEDNLPLFVLNIESTADVATSTGFWDLRISLFVVKALNIATTSMAATWFKTKGTESYPLILANRPSSTSLGTYKPPVSPYLAKDLYQVKPGLGFSESNPEILHLSDLGPEATASQISSSGTKPELDTCLPLLQTEFTSSEEGSLYGLPHQWLMSG
ncbi:hypothetical protein VNO77_32484 [Canavalia gladiata]|uniref:Uncharacterized protein n=1 Tax=Canavalia gladiata TaxID=3824 RepID=A0AAN9Q4F4_CANGL